MQYRRIARKVNPEPKCCDKKRT